MLIFRERILKSVLIGIAKDLEEQDQEILNTRNKKRYIPVKIKKRKITTEFGVLIFKRRIYKYYNEKIQKWCYIALLDEKVKLKKWAKVDPDFKVKILKQLGSDKRYQDIIDIFPEAGVSKMMVSRIFQKVNHKRFKNKVLKKVTLRPGQRVYLNLDDTFPKVKVGKRVKELMTRVVSFNTGFDQKKSTQKRKVLANKKIFFLFERLTTIELVQQIIEWGNLVFENFNESKLVVGRDGANWIQNLAEELNADYVLDKYHAVKYIQKVFYINWHHPYQNMTNWKRFKKARAYYDDGEYEKLYSMLEKYADDDLKRETLNYFRNNRRGVENYGQAWNIGVSAESDVSRLVKSTLGYGTRIFSFKTFRNILFKKSYMFNNA